MAKKKLARYVNLAGTVYGPGDDVPAGVLERITNPRAFEPDDTATSSSEGATGGQQEKPATRGGRTSTKEE